MAKRFYGNLINRFEEGKTVPEIKEGMDITMYHWSDRSCYYVTFVGDQQHIKVKEYEVVADHSKECGMGHQNWLYFKTRKEENDYLAEIFPDRYSKDTVVEEPEEELWVYRYNHWNRAYIYTKEDLDKKSCMGLPMRDVLDPKDVKKIESGKPVTKYYKIDEGLSFDRRDYYYDWEF